MMTAAPPFQPQDPAFLANPYPFYARWREHTPIFFHEPWQAWVFMRYHDIVPLLRDKRLGRVMGLLPVGGAYPEFAAAQRGTLLETEPPDHTRIRQVVHEAFTPRHVRALQSSIRAVCQQLVEGLKQRPERRANILTDFAEPLPVTVIAELLGVPQTDRHKLLPWSKGMIGMFEPERTPEMASAANQAAAEFRHYIRELAQVKRIQPEDDLITRFVQAHDADPEGFSEDELINNCILFLNAGHEAVVNVIGNGLRALLSHPESWSALQHDLSLVPSAVEEMMRFDTPLQFFERYVLEPVEVAGVSLDHGEKVCLYYGSANHDGEVFDRPDRFDIRRDPNPHIAFGLGVHYCIGAPLARLELTTALHTLLTELPQLQLTGEPLHYWPKNVFRYLRELPVTY